MEISSVTFNISKLQNYLQSQLFNMKKLTNQNPWQKEKGVIAEYIPLLLTNCYESLSPSVLPHYWYFWFWQNHLLISIKVHISLFTEDQQVRQQLKSGFLKTAIVSAVITVSFLAITEYFQLADLVFNLAVLNWCTKTYLEVMLEDFLISSYLNMRKS